MTKQLLRVLLAIAAGWLGWTITPMAFAGWTHGREFVGLTAQERFQWVADPRWLGLMSIAMPLLYGVNARILNRVTVGSVVGWAALMGSYVLSLVHFDWIESIEGHLPSLLGATVAGLFGLALLLSVPTVAALAIRSLQPSHAEARSVSPR